MSSTLKSVLVTGGAGFVGSWLVRALLESTSARITVVDNLRNGRREYLPASDRLKLVNANVTDSVAVEAAIAEARPEWVFHLAALHFIPYCNAHPEETIAVNIGGTQTVLEACRKHPPAVLVAASTAAVYPIKDGANREDDPLGPTDIYGLTKLVNEQQLGLYSKQCPTTRCAATRFSNVFGPHETNPHVIPEILEQMVRGQFDLGLGNVKPLRDYIYVSDVASALVAVARHAGPAFRVFNVSTASEHSVEEVVAQLASTSGCNLRIVTDPARVRPSDRMHLLCDNTRVREETGWKPRFDLASGLRDLWAWTCRESAATPVTVG